MSFYDPKEYNFILRTKEIIRQYEECSISNGHKYETTLFVNCLFGLLIIPKEHWFDLLPNKTISIQEWGIAPHNITFILGRKMSVQHVVQRMRNSIAHNNFTLLEEPAGEIGLINFQDFEYKCGFEMKTFDATFNIYGIREFAENVANYVLQYSE